MKKILALVLASVIMVSTSISAYAAEQELEGSRSVTAEDIEKLQNEIDQLTGEIKNLTKAVQAAMNKGGGGGGRGTGTPSPSEPRSAILKRNNAVAYYGNTVAQGGHVEINGNKSNVTFVLTVPNSGIISSANQLAGSLGGVLINCVQTSSPGVAFTSAKCNFYCSGVVAGDNIAVYQQQKKGWVQLPVAEIRKDHVVVNMTGHGPVAFIRVPALATVTN
ncbi:hypothetical protein [Butyrivibrio sp. FCS014]|uniref:hypothetical protein n=2 Tax=Butyrivibrio sp. FCS014 TaxID=1408304 RepID=UPI000466B677|nr:hypothetical protein [Butyrivibrio sp. FCS014]